MSIERLAQLAGDEWHWWMKRLEKEDKAELRHSYEEYRDGRFELDDDCLQLLDQLLSASPREKQKLLSQAEDRASLHVVLLHAYQRVDWAWRWLQAAAAYDVSEPGLDLLPHEAFRRAAEAAGHFCLGGFSLWPFAAAPMSLHAPREQAEGSAKRHP